MHARTCSLSCAHAASCQDDAGGGATRKGSKRRKNGGSQSQQFSQGGGCGSWREFSSEPQQDLLLTSSQNYNKRAAHASQDSGLIQKRKKKIRSYDDLDSLQAGGLFLPPSGPKKGRDNLADRLISAAKKQKPSDTRLPAKPAAKIGSDEKAVPRKYTDSNQGFHLSSERRAAQYKNQLRGIHGDPFSPAVHDPFSTSAVPQQPIATLMEAHECGEMMETLDEVSFALDGLRQAGMVCVQRASALSLAVVCSSPDKRRLLRAKG